MLNQVVLVGRLTSDLEAKELEDAEKRVESLPEKTQEDEVPNYEYHLGDNVFIGADEYYISLLNYMSENRSSAGLNAYAGKNVFDEYRYRVCNEADIAKPYIQNELLAYALKPTLRYGTYIPDFTVMEDNKGVVL